MSPVYWKLPGAAEGTTPPLERYRNAATSSSSSAPLNVEVSVEDSAYACEVLLSLRSDIRMPSDNNKENTQQGRSGVTFAPSSSEQQLIGKKRKMAEASKSKRSDSSHTDSEDQTDESSEVSKSVQLRIKLSPTCSSPRKQNSPRPISTSPRLNYKRIRNRSSSPFAGAQGAPPTAEEFARIVMQHEQDRQQQQVHLQQSSSQPVMSTGHTSSGGPLPGLASTQLSSQIAPFNNLTATSPLLSSLLNPDYPTNKAIVANVILEESKRKP
jgi:hypothetical protein